MMIKNFTFAFLSSMINKEGIFGDDFMRDPFAALKDALQRVFHLEAMRNGRYIYPEIRHLKQAVDNFQPNNKRNFIALLKALRASLPHIEKNGVLILKQSVSQWTLWPKNLIYP